MHIHKKGGAKRIRENSRKTISFFSSKHRSDYYYTVLKMMGKFSRDIREKEKIEFLNSIFKRIACLRITFEMKKGNFARIIVWYWLQIEKIKKINWGAKKFTCNKYFSFLFYHFKCIPSATSRKCFNIFNSRTYFRSDKYVIYVYTLVSRLV